MPIKRGYRLVLKTKACHINCKKQKCHGAQSHNETMKRKRLKEEHISICILIQARHGRLVEIQDILTRSLCWKAHGSSLVKIRNAMSSSDWI